MKQKVALYCRISNDDKKQSESIQNQKLLLTNYAQQKNWIIFHIYCDENYSGLDDNRPDFCRMISDAKKGLFSIILCKTQSRFTRNIATAEKYLHQNFPIWGVRFVTVVDHVDTFLKENKKSRQINSLINEWYCEEISENIKNIFYQKQIKGQFLGNYAPYGYQKSSLDKHKLEIDQKIAPIIRFIFEQYAYHHISYAHIASILTAKGIPTPAQYKASQGKDIGRKVKHIGIWSASTIRHILHNTVYIGHMVQGKEKKINYKSKKVISIPPENWIVVKNTHPPIISPMLFSLCQKQPKIH